MLKQEIQSRKITKQQREDFMKKAMAYDIADSENPDYT